MNQITIIGKLGRDPEKRTTNTGKTVASFSVAVKGNSKDDVTWFRVSCWEKSAEYVCEYLGKGRLVAVTGRMTSRKFTGSDGNEREIWEIVAGLVQGLDRPRDEPNPITVPAEGEYDPFGDSE